MTAEFIDYQARLRILQTRKALLSDLLLDADTTDEILRLSGQIEDVQLRIEQLQGQLRFLNDQVAESTLRVSIQEQSAPAAAGQPAVDNPDLGSSFDLAVQGFLRIVGAVIVGLGYLIPITAIAAIVVDGRLVRPPPPRHRRELPSRCARGRGGAAWATWLLDHRDAENA